MYENMAKPDMMIGSYESKLTSRVDQNPTVGENIDARIAMLKIELARLEESKETLAPLLGMRILDIRDAINY